MSSFLLSTAAGIATALLLAIARQVWRISKTVTESAAATARLTDSVAVLQAHDQQNREHIAALWARAYPSGPPPLWSPGEPSRLQRTRPY